jgi:diguanylate cyclase (GGDEF)-like protein
MTQDARRGIPAHDTAKDLAGTRPERLDELIARVAVRLMAGSRDSMSEVLEWMLRSLAAAFRVDAVLLHRHHVDERLSVLVDEWPRRPAGQLGVITLGADPLMRKAAQLRSTLVSTIDITDEHVSLLGWGPSGQARVAVVPLVSDSEAIGTLTLVTFHERAWAAEEIQALEVIASLVAQLQTRVTAEAQLQHSRHQRHLDELVTRVAVRLMSASRDSVSLVIEWTLRTLGEFFDFDVAFLRRNDHERGVTILVDQWPRRENVPDPDPIGVVPFDADPVFGATRVLREPYVTRPGNSQEYQDRIKEGSGIPEVSMATVPLVHEDVTEGILGFIKFGDRPWEDEEINALQAVASLLMQLQARIDAENQLHHTAFHDALTSLPNRRFLLAELDRRVQTRERESIAVLFLDIDRFKTLNDALGHHAGDRLLVTTADRLRTTMRPNDFVARVMGDEFVVILETPTDHFEAFAAAERIRELVAFPVEVGGPAVNRTVSIGVAIGEDGVTGEQLLVNADTALHEAKARGRNQVVFFDEELDGVIKERLDTELLLRRALEDNRLELYYQPEIDLRTGQLLAVEALMRWHHPDRGLLPAGAFIEIAEDSGFIVEFGNWVIEESIRQRGVWLRQYPDLEMTIRINLSPAQLISHDIVALVADCLERHHVPGDVLCFEITEHAVMQDVDQAMSILKGLRELGAELAIDDFGTGHSSMVQLKRLHAATLKIDQSFVAGLPDDTGDRAIIESVVHLAKAFHADVVAEGVETHEQVASLLELGCHRAQGFLFCEPLPVGGLEPLFERQQQLVLASPP